MKTGIFNRQSILELTLLALFATGLFVSKIFVDYKCRIILGPEIQLASSGLTVSLPAQNDWRGLKQWQYERDNTFVLDQTTPTIDVLWKYILTSAPQSSRQVLEELVSETGSILSETQSTKGDCPMEYVVIPVSPVETRAIGVVMLDFGRVLVLQVKGQINSPFSVENMFLALAGSLKYNKPDELTRGVEFLERARSFGTGLFLSDPSRQYRIRDASGNIGGYETIHTRVDSQQRLHIARLTSLPTGVVKQREHQFESANPLEMFNWVCRNSANTRPLGTFCLEFKENRVLIIEDTAGKTQTVQPGPAVAGEILLDWLVRYFLEIEQQKITVDLLYFDGQIIPTHIFLLPPAQALGKTENLAFAVRAESLAGSAWEFYFDADKKLLGKITLELPRKILLWDSVGTDEIEKYLNIPTAPKGPMARRDVKKENTLFGIIKEKRI
jgi:hypothetical protein